MKHIKLRIIWNLFISMIIAAVISLAVFIAFFGILQIISQEMYADFLKLCYANTLSITVTSTVILMIYLLVTLAVFTYRLKDITDSIKMISKHVHKLATGELEDKLVLKSQDELGGLAEDINCMSTQIDALIKNEKKLNDERYHIITNISHDLKTPIMSLQGYIQLIKNRKCTDEAELDSYCEIVANKSEELSNAINQLFELSRLNSAEIKLMQSRICLKEFVEQIIVSYIPTLEQRNMEIRLAIPMNIKVEVDALLMKRVFDNLIVNAIKYAANGKYLDITAEEQDEIVRIHLTNYGPMITKEELEHIFDRYYREKKNMKNEGNGLGLAIARTILQLHSGALSVTSDVTKTDFYIDLVRTKG